jgi:hypothetical protein
MRSATCVIQACGVVGPGIYYTLRRIGITR